MSEDGTTAAAGSGVSVDAAAAAPTRTSAQLYVDRPFLFLIRDMQTGQPLFLGQVTNPQG